MSTVIQKQWAAPLKSSAQRRECCLCGSRKDRLIFVKNGFQIHKCRECELVFVANPPTPDKIAGLYEFSAGYHSSLADDALENMKRRASQQFSLMKTHFKSPARVLDVGSSAGQFLHVCEQAGWEVMGLEISEDTAELARRRFNLEVKTGSIQDVELPTEYFDAITFWDVLEHLPDPVSALQSAVRALKPKGLIFITTPDIGGLFPRLSYLAARIIGYWPHPEPPHHLYQFSQHTLRLCLERSGLEAEHLISERIPFTYTFGRGLAILKSPKHFLYALAFAPTCFLGPYLGIGDSMTVVASHPLRPCRDSQHSATRETG